MLFRSIVVVATSKYGRRALGTLMFTVFGELIVGIYLSFVPIRNAPELIPQLLLVGAAIVIGLIAISLLGKRGGDRKSTRLNSSHIPLPRMPSSA